MAQHGMVSVTKEQFFSAVGPLNVHPRPEPDRSLWIDQRTHAVVGATTPGYLCQGAETYLLIAAIATTPGGAA